MKRFAKRLAVWTVVLHALVLPVPAVASDDTVGVDHRNALERLVDDKVSARQRELAWLVGDFNRYSAIATVLVAGAATAAAASDAPFRGLGGGVGEQGDVVKLGDRMSSLPISSAYLTSLVARDYRGFVYMGLHNVVSSGAVRLLKDGVGQRRPGDQDSRSFPSGHANTAFLGAAFLQQRYGPRWGIPSYVSALIVAWSRVYGNKHYVNDVISGASIGMMSAWATVPPYDAERLARWQDPDRERPFRYEWEMTLNTVDRNVVQSPAGSGDVFVSPLDTAANEPWANSHVAFEYRADAHQSWHGMFTPWEIRSFGRFTQPTVFAGTTFPADQDLRVAHLVWNYGVQYRRVLLENGTLRLRGGGGVSGQYAEEEIFVVDETQPEKRGLSASSDARAWYAVAHADAAIHLFWKLYLGAEADYGWSGKSHYADWTARLTARLSPKWDTSLGWREFETDFDKADLRDDFARSGLAVNFAYAF